VGITFTDRELDIMNILWDEGSATVTEAREILDEDLAYTSVLTVFQTLERKGHVHHEQEGKAYRYHPNVSREEAGRDALSYVLEKVFKDSAEALVTSLVSTKELDEAEIRRLNRMLEKQA
jgi:predicted transcriptional regulator